MRLICQHCNINTENCFSTQSRISVCWGKMYSLSYEEAVPKVLPSSLNSSIFNTISNMHKYVKLLCRRGLERSEIASAAQRLRDLQSHAGGFHLSLTRLAMAYITLNIYLKHLSCSQQSFKLCNTFLNSRS